MAREEDSPVVSIIIPHYLGDILSECLSTVYDRTPDILFEVIVADDQPYDDGSLERAAAQFPDIRVVKTGGGKGMGAGCNRGLEVARGRYGFLLNNDVEVSEGWLPPLLDLMEGDESIGACQPKVRSLRERARFDYGGAAGGMIDSLGFTFCRGRIFETVEEDKGQYDQSVDIFWAVGGAMFIRMACLERTGLMDEAFVMHMEEIDLCWRFHLAGYRIVSAPESVVYHYGGFSLQAESFQKTYFNHRNQLVMMLKNLPLARLAWVFPIRVLLMSSTFLLTVLKGDWKHLAGFLKGGVWILFHPVNIWRRRQVSRTVRKVPDRQVVGCMYTGSIVWTYFLKRRRTAAELSGRSGR